MSGFEDFYEKTKSGFYRFLLNLSRDEDTAKDIFQESYYRYMKNYKEFSQSLLYQIGRNVFFNIYKYDKRNLPIEELDFYKYDSFSDDNLLLQKVLDCLNDEERELVILSMADGLKYEEISKITGLTVSNIKVKIHRLRNKISELI